ncbi:hypothetical protein ISS40_05060 [Candidatus Bathyarchaeota archaeon]|nr:hypothetical protein [Candidatus Bathyarchaeota archaeon]MBL7168023.1 hypothetical protein [Candidatus Bathyarchaeota archaeon]
MSEKTIIELYNEYANKSIEEAKAKKARNTSLEYKLHYEMVEIRSKISREIEKISGIARKPFVDDE